MIPLELLILSIIGATLTIINALLKASTGKTAYALIKARVSKQKKRVEESLKEKDIDEMELCENINFLIDLSEELIFSYRAH